MVTSLGYQYFHRELNATLSEALFDDSSSYYELLRSANVIAERYGLNIIQQLTSKMIIPHYIDLQPANTAFEVDEIYFELPAENQPPFYIDWTLWEILGAESGLHPDEIWSCMSDIKKMRKFEGKNVSMPNGYCYAYAQIMVELWNVYSQGIHDSDYVSEHTPISASLFNVIKHSTDVWKKTHQRLEDENSSLLACKKIRCEGQSVLLPKEVFVPMHSDVADFSKPGIKHAKGHIHVVFPKFGDKLKYLHEVFEIPDERLSKIVYPLQEAQPPVSIQVKKSKRKKPDVKFFDQDTKNAENLLEAEEAFQKMVMAKSSNKRNDSMVLLAESLIKGEKEILQVTDLNQVPVNWLQWFSLTWLPVSKYKSPPLTPFPALFIKPFINRLIKQGLIPMFDYQHKVKESKIYSLTAASKFKFKIIASKQPTIAKLYDIDVTPDERSHMVTAQLRAINFKLPDQVELGSIQPSAFLYNPQNAPIEKLISLTERPKEVRFEKVEHKKRHAEINPKTSNIEFNRTAPLHPDTLVHLQQSGLCFGKDFRNQTNSNESHSGHPYSRAVNDATRYPSVNRLLANIVTRGDDNDADIMSLGAKFSEIKLYAEKLAVLNKEKSAEFKRVDVPQARADALYDVQCNIVRDLYRLIADRDLPTMRVLLQGSKLKLSLRELLFLFPPDRDETTLVPVSIFGYSNRGLLGDDDLDLPPIAFDAPELRYHAKLMNCISSDLRKQFTEAIKSAPLIKSVPKIDLIKSNPADNLRLVSALKRHASSIFDLILNILDPQPEIQELRDRPLATLQEKIDIVCADYSRKADVRKIMALFSMPTSIRMSIIDIFHNTQPIKDLTKQVYHVLETTNATRNFQRDHEDRDFEIIAPDSERIRLQSHPCPSTFLRSYRTGTLAEADDVIRDLTIAHHLSPNAIEAALWQFLFHYADLQYYALKRVTVWKCHTLLNCLETSQGDPLALYRFIQKCIRTEGFHVKTTFLRLDSTAAASLRSGKYQLPSHRLQTEIVQNPLIERTGQLQNAKAILKAMQDFHNAIANHADRQMQAEEDAQIQGYRNVLGNLMQNQEFAATNSENRCVLIARQAARIQELEGEIKELQSSTIREYRIVPNFVGNHDTLEHVPILQGVCAVLRLLDVFSPSTLKSGIALPNVDIQIRPNEITIDQVRTINQHWKALTFVLHVPVIRYITARPRTEYYDQTYYIDNIPKTEEYYNRYVNSRHTQPIQPFLFVWQRFETILQDCVYFKDSFRTASLVKTFFEVNDVAYYIPYLKFPNEALVSITNWEYHSLPSDEPAPYGEGRIKNELKTLQQLQEWVHSYPSWCFDKETFLQDWLFALELDDFSQFIRPVWSHNESSGASRKYSGWNVRVLGGDISVTLGIHRITNYTGCGAGCKIRVKPGFPYNHSHRLSLHHALKYENASSLPVQHQDLPIIKTLMKDTKPAYLEFTKYAEETIKRASRIYDRLSVRSTPQRVSATLSQTFFSVLHSKASGLLIKPSGFFSKAVYLSTNEPVADLDPGFCDLTEKIKNMWKGLWTKGDSWWNFEHSEKVCNLPEDRQYLTLGGTCSLDQNPLVNAERCLSLNDHVHLLNVVRESEVPARWSKKAVIPQAVNDCIASKTTELDSLIKDPVLDHVCSLVKQNNYVSIKHIKEFLFPKDKIKPPITQKHPAITSTLTFHTKPVPPKNLVMLSHPVLQPQLNPRLEQISAAVGQWADNHNSQISGEPPRSQMTYKTGYDVQDKCGNILKPFEWDSKSPYNLIVAAFCRQLGSKNSPHPFHIHCYAVMMNNFFEHLQHQISLIDLDSMTFKTPYSWLRNKQSWDREKKFKYLLTMSKQASGVLKEFMGAFSVMVKSGEQFFSTEDKLQLNLLFGEDSRPRAISAPSSQLCGYMTYLQSVLIFPVIKKLIPGFMHGLSCHDLTEKITADTSHLDFKRLKAVSFDGSGFDSNQHFDIQQIADIGLFNSFKPLISRFIYKYQNALCIQDAGVFLASLETSWTQLTFDWFLVIPGIEDYIDNSADNKAYNRFFGGRQQKSAIKFNLTGTTFSGHPTLTTLGNTFRSLTYMWYALWSKNIEEPWKPNHVAHCIAAGDDSVAFIHTDYVSLFVDTLKEHFAPNKSEMFVGLGQCIDKHTIFVLDSFNFDFCSKWCFYNGKDWLVTRDYQKMLWNKQMYDGTCQVFQNDPSLHSVAIYQALVAEGVHSGFLHDLQLARTGKYLKDMLLKRELFVREDKSYLAEDIYDWWLQENSWSIHYQRDMMHPDFIAMIDSKLGLDTIDFLTALFTNCITLS